MNVFIPIHCLGQNRELRPKDKNLEGLNVEDEKANDCFERGNERFLCYFV